jgi:hypothetical protein
VTHARKSVHRSGSEADRRANLTMALWDAPESAPRVSISGVCRLTG